MKFSFDQYDRMTSWLSLYIQHTMGKTVYKFQIHKNYLKSTFTTPVTCFWSDAQMNPRISINVKKYQVFIGHRIHFMIFLLSFNLQLFRVFILPLYLIYIFIFSTYSLKPRMFFITDLSERAKFSCIESIIFLQIMKSTIEKFQRTWHLVSNILRKNQYPL